jgi:hypothetical protein
MKVQKEIRIPKKAKEPATVAAEPSPELGAAGETSTSENAKGVRPSPEGKPARSKVPFWELVQSLGDKWATGDYTLYVYRKWPVIDRADTDHFIAKLREPIDPDYLLRTFGTGKYSLQLNDAQGKMVSYKIEAVHHPDCPPKLNQAEITRDPANDVYWATWGKRSNGGDAKPERETITKENIAEIIRAAQEGNKLDPQMVGWLQSMANARDELAGKLAQGTAKSPVDDVATLAKALKDMMPSPAAAASAPPQPDLLSIIASVKSLQADPLSMLEKLKGFFPAREPDPTRADAAPANSLDELKKVLEVFGQAKSLFTPEAAPAAAFAASPDASPWEQLAVQLSGVIAPILNGISGIIMAAKSKPGDTAAMAGMPAAPAPIAFNPYDANAMQEFLRAQKAAATRPQPAPAPSPVASPPGTGTPPATAEAQPEPGPQDIMQQVFVIVAQALNCLNRDVDGHEAAASIIALNGGLTYETIAQQIQTAGIPVVLELATNTNLAPQVAAYEGQLRKFLEEFVEGPAWNDDEDPKAEEPATAS